MIPDVGGGSTLSRMSSTVHYFNWLHLVFVFKTSKVFAEGRHSPEAQASPRTHAPMSVTTTVAEVLLQSWRSREGFVSLLGGDWTHSLVHARHYHWAHLHISMLRRLKWSSCPSFLSVWDFGCVLPHTQPGSFNICHLWGRVLHRI